MASVTSSINKVLDRLRGALGTGETPANSNHNFITEWYNKNVEKIGDGPWCEMTGSWAMHTGGAKTLKKARAYTVWAAQDAQARVNASSWHYGTKGMRAGDQVYYDWKGGKGSVGIVDHTGIVEKILGDGTFYVLEGNTSGNKLQRMRRDGKYIVGYIRFAWESLAPVVPTPSVPPTSVKPKPNPTEVKKLQKLLETPQNGRWDKLTDTIARNMRAAARAHVGYPKKVAGKVNVKSAQLVVDTKSDGVWGIKTQTGLVNWVKEFQKAFGLTPDGQWGPRTDNAFLAARKRNLNNT
jgi:peptidoglycan hydrolase-like protein with peptidoglycan-binding domain